MILYKLGSIWGTGAPDFYEMIKNKNISLSHIGDCNPKKDSIVLITKGHTVKAITVLLEDCQPVTNNPDLKNSFDEYNISYNSETLYARSKWIELKPQDYFLFKTQDGICRIHKQEIHQITKSLILKYMINGNLDQQIDLLKYKKQIILQGPPGTGKTKTAKDLAVKILNLNDYQHLINNEQFKLIQFHPSYTYEDFVRGIISTPNEDGEGVLFKTENKILAEFAEKALKNKLNSQKNANELSQEKWLNEQFELFIDSLSDYIDEKGDIELTESVFIVELDKDAFRYKGLEGWSKKGNRMLFKDIKQAYLDKNLDRQNVKHNQNLSGLAKWHASYYIRVLDMFRKFLNDNELIFIVNSTEKEELKNYVLVIDEINRANLPSVLGELIYALEYRDEPVQSMYEYEEKREIILPSNLYIIGTMNTADRSVGHIDYAIKRRFSFVDVLPTDQAIDDVITDPELNAKAKSLYHKVADLFNEDKNKTVYLQSDFKAKDVQLGHSYFLVETEKQLKLKLDFEIKPLLNEYVKDGILSEETLQEIAKL